MHQKTDVKQLCLIQAAHTFNIALPPPNRSPLLISKAQPQFPSLPHESIGKHSAACAKSDSWSSPTSCCTHCSIHSAHPVPQHLGRVLLLHLLQHMAVLPLETFSRKLTPLRISFPIGLHFHLSH